MWGQNSSESEEAEGPMLGVTEGEGSLALALTDRRPGSGSLLQRCCRGDVLQGQRSHEELEVDQDRPPCPPPPCLGPHQHQRCKSWVRELLSGTDGVSPKTKRLTGTWGATSWP